MEHLKGYQVLTRQRCKNTHCTDIRLYSTTIIFNNEEVTLDHMHPIISRLDKVQYQIIVDWFILFKSVHFPNTQNFLMATEMEDCGRADISNRDISRTSPWINCSKGQNVFARCVDSTALHPLPAFHSTPMQSYDVPTICSLPSSLPV